MYPDGRKTGGEVSHIDGLHYMFHVYKGVTLGEPKINIMISVAQTPWYARTLLIVGRWIVLSHVRTRSDGFV